MKKKTIFENKPLLRGLKFLLWGACVVSLVLELFVHRHPHFGFDAFFGFYAVLGFVSCSILVLVAKVLGIFLKVKESYYKDE